MATKKPRPLTADTIEKLLKLGKLGPSITPADAAKILDVTEAAVAAYLATAAGGRAWQKARAEGRAEEVTVLRRLALEGSPQAQKQLRQLNAVDDTAKATDLRLGLKDFRDVINRGTSPVKRRIHAGDLPPPGADQGYKIADLLKAIPMLWDKLSAARETIAQLEKLTDKVRTDRAEAERLLKLEQVRQRKRENDIAEGRLVDIGVAQKKVDQVCALIRDAARQMTDEITLKLALPDTSSHVVTRARVAMLDRLATHMEQAAQSHQ